MIKQSQIAVTNLIKSNAGKHIIDIKKLIERIESDS